MLYENICTAINENANCSECSALSVIFGETLDKKLIDIDISSYSHVTVSGASGTGKSTLLHSFILSVVDRYSSEEVKLLFFDADGYEFTQYAKLPHILFSASTNVVKIVAAFQWLSEELAERYSILSQYNIKNLSLYNEKAVALGLKTLSRILVVVDELNDLPDVEPVQSVLIKLIRLGSRIGIHLIVASQNPLTKNGTVVFGAGLPLRAVFSIGSPKERKLLFKGHKIFDPAGFGNMIIFDSTNDSGISVVGYNIDFPDIHTIVSKQPIVEPEELLVFPSYEEEKQSNLMIYQAVELILDLGTAKLTDLQRRLSLNYRQAAELMEELETLGFVGEFNGTANREILITNSQWEKMHIYNLRTPLEPSKIDVSHIVCDVNDCYDKNVAPEIKLTNSSKFSKLTNRILPFSFHKK